MWHLGWLLWLLWLRGWLAGVCCRSLSRGQLAQVQILYVQLPTLQCFDECLKITIACRRLRLS
jgi:hypothetical protein